MADQIQKIFNNCSNKFFFLQSNEFLVLKFWSEFKSEDRKFYRINTTINNFKFYKYFCLCQDKLYSGFRTVAIQKPVLEATYSECGKGMKRSNETVTKICMNCTNESLHVTEKKWYIYMKNIYITKW